MTTTDNILNIFDLFRMTPLSIDEYEAIGKQVLRDKILPFVLRNEPIKFSIMGFPMKSTNTRDKVLGKLPDFAEQLTMDNFKEFNNRIKTVYTPGVNITIASDGFAFSDVLKVDNSTVDAYQEVSMDMVGDAPIKFMNLRDFYDHNTSIPQLQSKMIEHYGITPEELERRILMDADVNMLYRGMMRFMEEEIAPMNFPSRNQLNKNAKILTREMMLRNEAYSGLVRSQLSDHIRLSMHPSINNGVKYSFQLIRSPKAFRSAWHCAILINADGTVETVHRKDAEEAGHELIYKDNQAWAFQA